MISLFDYQKEAIEQFKDKPLNLSDVGTGKSYMSIGSYIKSGCNKLLVICLAPKVLDFVEDGEQSSVHLTEKELRLLKARLTEAINIVTMNKSERGRSK